MNHQQVGRIRWANIRARHAPSSGVPFTLAVILTAMVVITVLQVMMIVYSGRFQSDANASIPVSRSPYHSSFTKEISRIKDQSVQGGRYDARLSDPSPSNTIELRTIRSVDTGLVDSPSPMPINSSSYYYYYYYDDSNNATNVSQELQLELTSFPKAENLPYKIVWLMSFPNSGTSYTMQAVRKYTRLCTATNYMEESDDAELVFG
jgi:hypothetical protein